MRRVTISSVDRSIEIRGIAERGEGTGVRGALAGIGVMMSGAEVSGRKKALSPNDGGRAGAGGSDFARSADGVGCGAKTSSGASGV